MRPLPASSSSPPQLGQVCPALQLRGLDGVQDAFAPVDEAGEETESDEIVEVAFDLFARQPEFQGDIDDRELAAGHEHVEEAALLAHAFARLFFGAAAGEEEDAAADERRDENEEGEEEAEHRAGALQRAFAHPGQRARSPMTRPARGRQRSGSNR